MEFLENAENFLPVLRQIPWLSEPEIATEHGVPVLRVRATEMDIARKELPRLISESGLTLTRYELSLPGIEEIFVEILKNGDKQ
jgi:ABC-2 type transport system ATP-binding protein